MRPFPVHGASGDEYVFLTPANLRAEQKRFAGPAYDNLSPLTADTVLGTLSGDPSSQSKLRELWTLWHGRPPQHTARAPRIVADLKGHVERGQLLLLRRVPPRVPTLVQAPPNVVPVRVQPEPVKDYLWRLECEHHKKRRRDLIQDRALIQIVPSENEEEQVIIHLREKHDRGTPASLKVGTEEIRRSHAGGRAEKDGGYDLYPLKAKWKGTHEGSFPNPQFWREYAHVDTYEVSGVSPAPRIEVYSQHKYKLEMALPPCKEFKTGAKLGEVVQAAKNLALGRPSQGPVWKPDKGNEPWTPSNLDLSKVKQLKFTRDDVKVNVPILELIGAVQKAAQGISLLASTIQENVPQVGWYMQFGFKLLEGALAIEWCWKEHTDYRVFQYIDFASQLTLFAISLEVGFGLKVGFKAQAYLLMEGDVTAGANACRAHPDCVVSFKIPVGATIKGSVGARVEAGKWVKIDAHGESGIEFKGEMTVNRSPSEMLTVDAAIAWTGLKVVASYSLGPDGIMGGKQWQGELMGPVELTTFHWPGDKYEPPKMSVSGIASILEDVITEGTDVRVYGTSSWGAPEIARTLAQKMDEHSTFQRVPKIVEGISHAIRADLDELVLRSNERHWLMKVIPEAVFRTYVNGPQLKAHLDRAVNPAQSIITAA